MKPLLILLTLLVLFASGCGDSGNPTGSGGPDKYYPLTVTLRDDHDRPVVNAAVVAMPVNTTQLPDSAGVARFDSLGNKTTAIHVERPYYQSDIVPVTRSILSRGDLSVTLETRGPIITILSPAAGIVVSGSPVHFSAEGIDPEDGVIDDTLVWYSDIDGQIGSGAEMIFGGLSPHIHIITCSAVDSDGNADSTSVTVDVRRASDPKSYFPVTPRSWWQYGHPVNSYNITREKDGLVENWTLGDIGVEIDTHSRRTTTLDICYTLRNIIKYYEYTVVDQLRLDGDAMYVTSTVETMEMHENRIDNPVFYRAEVTTEYSPEYLLIPDMYDPASTPLYDATVRADATWQYNPPFDPEFVFTESYTVHTAVTVGEPEFIATSFMGATAVPVTYTQGDIYKTWWAAPGVGIVKMEYISYGVPTMAVLESASFTGKAAVQPFTAPRSESPAPALKAYSLPAMRDDAGFPVELSEFQRLSDVARTFLPR